MTGTEEAFVGHEVTDKCEVSKATAWFRDRVLGSVYRCAVPLVRITGWEP